MSIVGRWLGIKSYKHDGAIHRLWDRGFVVEQNEDYIVIASKKAKVVENNGRRWFTKEPAVTIFFKHEWFNVICMLKNDGICYYCNIASPAMVQKGNIIYIDYDLDTKKYSDGTIKVLDEKEYSHHKMMYRYSDDLDVVLKKTTNMTLQKMKESIFPFNDNMVKDYYKKYIEMTEAKNE